MTEKKVTKRENFTAIKEILFNQGYSDLVEFMEREIELLNRKNTQRKTKPNESREALKATVLEILKSHDRMRVSDIIKVLGNDYSTSKISNICHTLQKEGKAENIIEKRVSYFKAVEG